MTLVDSVLHLVRARARIELEERPATDSSTRGLSPLPTGALVEDAARLGASSVPSDMDEVDREGLELVLGGSEALRDYVPGLADLEAAVSLVSSGIATRVTLSGFPSWPGLLWRAYQLARGADVLILPTLVHPGGKVDLVVAKDPTRHG